MGYTSAIGTMLMDEMAGVCGWAEERFTGIQTDIGKLETELLKAHDWSARAQDQIDGLETHVRRLDASRRAMREDMDEMTRNMNGDLAMHGRTSEGRTSTREREGWAPAVLRREIR